MQRDSPSCLFLSSINVCGINGIIALRRELSAPDGRLRQVVAGMNEALAHRGPDGQGIFERPGVVLGHRRLSIIDLSDDGAQPMFNEDHTIAVVFNGEIYNFLELVPELVARGHRFRSHCDTEVIIHAYEEWGPESVTRFNGMWSFALYDMRRNLLFASRDRLGVKPFYYHVSPEHFVFSSELKSLLLATDDRRANLGKVYDYLAYGYKTNNGDTFFAGAQELPPATNLVIQGDQIRTSTYWELPIQPPRRGGLLDAHAEEFRSLLTDAVRLRFRSDVPVAILLSGGLDSTTITRIVDDLADSGVLPYSKVKAFSASFPGYRDDEGEVVRRFIDTCRHIDLVQIYPSAERLAQSMDTIAYAFGEPVFSTTAFAHYELMREVHAEGTKVVLNGQGSDEAFCGYDRYFAGYFLLDKLLSSPNELPKQFKAMQNVLGYTSGFLLAQCIKALLPRRQSSYLRGRYQEGLIACLDSSFVKANYRYMANGHSKTFGARNLDAYLRDQLQYYGFNQILHYEDHSAMAHSIEIRSPFIDYRLMEFAFALPLDSKFDCGETKRVVRRAMTGRLPQEIIGNPRKIGFSTPFADWLSNGEVMRVVRDIVSSADFQNRRIWDASRLRHLFARPEAFPRFPFWRVLNLELWARAYHVSGL